MKNPQGTDFPTSGGGVLHFLPFALRNPPFGPNDPPWPLPRPLPQAPHHGGNPSEPSPHRGARAQGPTPAIRPFPRPGGFPLPQGQLATYWLSCLPPMGVHPSHAPADNGANPGS